MEDLDLLEKRVHGLIRQLKDLKEDKLILQNKLDEQAKSAQRVEYERSELRGRVEKILGTLAHLDQDLDGSVNKQEELPEQPTTY